jgi:Rab-GTPase-TBC domain
MSQSEYFMDCVYVFPAGVHEKGIGGTLKLTKAEAQRAHLSFRPHIHVRRKDDDDLAEFVDLIDNENENENDDEEEEEEQLQKTRARRRGSQDYALSVSLTEVKYIRRAYTSDGAYVIVTLLGGVTLLPLYLTCAANRTHDDSASRVTEFLMALSKFAALEKSQDDDNLICVQFPKPGSALPERADQFRDPLVEYEMRQAEIERLSELLAPPVSATASQGSWGNVFDTLTRVTGSIARTTYDTLWAADYDYGGDANNVGGSIGNDVYEDRQDDGDVVASDSLTLDGFEELGSSDDRSPSSSSSTTASSSSSLSPSSTKGLVLSRSPVRDEVTLADVEREEPLDEAEWRAMFDASTGRLAIDEATVRRRIFAGGVCASVRADVWAYLLGFYAFESSASERSALMASKRADYERMRRQWSTILAEQEANNSMFRALRHHIEKDVVRTDRLWPEYADEHSPMLGGLDSVLLTYAHSYNADLAYIQGMNDLASLVLIVAKGDNDDDAFDEALAFWLFASMMERVKANFYRGQHALRYQMAQIAQLIDVLDPSFYQYLDSVEGLNCYFSFRWLLCFFKREFRRADVLLIWDVLLSDGLEFRAGTQTMHLFLCVAIILSHRAFILDEHFAYDELLKFVNELANQLPRDALLMSAEQLYRKFIAITSDDDQQRLLRSPVFDQPQPDVTKLFFR